MAIPLRCIDQIILPAVRDSELIKIDPFFEPEIIADPVMRVVIAVRLHRDRIGCDQHAVRCLRIGDRRLSLPLVVLVASPDHEMIPCAAHTCIYLKNARVECVLNAHRCAVHAGKHDRVQDR